MSQNSQNPEFDQLLGSYLKKNGAKAFSEILALAGSKESEYSTGTDDTIFSRFCKKVGFNDAQKKEFNNVLRQIVTNIRNIEPLLGKYNPMDHRLRAALKGMIPDLHVPNTIRIAKIMLAGTPAVNDYLIATQEISKQDVKKVAAKVEEYLNNPENENPTLKGCLEAILKKETRTKEHMEFYERALEGPFTEMLRKIKEEKEVGFGKKVAEKVVISAKIVAHSIAVFVVTIVSIIISIGETKPVNMIEGVVGGVGAIASIGSYNKYRHAQTKLLLGAIDELFDRKHTKTFASRVRAAEEATNLPASDKMRSRWG